MRLRRLAIALLVALVGALWLPVHPALAVDYATLAAHWAPDFYQDLNATYSYEADFLTNFDYDGDWRGNNNWENLLNFPLHAYVYYSVVETETHWFIGYYTYHARDDGPTDPDKHENDLEGLLLVIRKDGSTYGSFQLMITLSHLDFYQYTNDPNITSGSDNVDGGVLMNGSHPEVFIQSNGQSPWGGHGVQAYDGSGAPGGDGIVYYYGGTASVPTNVSGDYTQRWSYALKSIDELWNRRLDQCNGCTFDHWGVFDGDTYSADAANAPWNWDDWNDGATFTGDILADPAHLVDTELNGLGTFSHVYVSNNYATHVITVSTVTSLYDSDPFGGASDIYVKAIAAGESVTDARLWKYNDSAAGVPRPVIWGANDAEAGAQYSSSYNNRYVAKPPGSTIQIQVLDSDGTSGDDDLGSVTAAPAVGDTVTWTGATTSNGKAQISASIQALR